MPDEEICHGWRSGCFAHGGNAQRVTNGPQNGLVLIEGAGCKLGLHLGPDHDGQDVASTIPEIVVPRFIPGDDDQAILLENRIVDDGGDVVLCPDVAAVERDIVRTTLAAAGTIVHGIDLIGLDEHEVGQVV